MRTLVVFVVIGMIAPLVPAVGVAANGQPKKALTKKDQASATSIVIRRSDLGQGFTAVARSKDESLPKGARCGALDESDLTVTGDAASPDFRFAEPSAFVTVGSTAQIYRTLREANASWSRGTTSQTTTCLSDIVRLSASPGEKITVQSATRVRFPSLSPKTTAYRLVLTVQIGGQKVRAYVDAVVLQHGRIQSGILFTSLGRPVDQAQRVALASVVAARMAKATRPSGPIA
jgi:hypothetical protein